MTCWLSLASSGMAGRHDMGRPSDYSDDIAREICSRLSEGRSLREICRAEDMPHESTVRKWAMEDRGGFYTHYARAREIGYHSMADEVLEIADDGSNDWMLRKGEGEETAYTLNGEHVQRSRLRVDTRKWMLAKALPKIYGDKIELGGSIGIRHEDALGELE